MYSAKKYMRGLQLTSYAHTAQKKATRNNLTTKIISHSHAPISYEVHHYVFRHNR
jgi:hypothetical protein